MLVCPSCGQEAQSGKFCAKCGAPMVQNENAPVTQSTVEEKTATPATPATPVQPSPQMEQIKQVSRGYLGHFKQVIVNPTKLVGNVSSLVDPIISLVLFSLVFALTIYSTLNSLYKESIGDWISMFSDTASSIPFSIAVKLFFIIAVLVLVPVACVFLLQKLFINEADFVKVFTQAMNYMPILICVSAAAFVLQLINAYSVTFVLLGLVLALALLLLPLFVISKNLVGKTPKIDAFFVYIILYVLILALHYIAIDSVFSTAISNIKEQFDELYYW